MDDKPLIAIETTSQLQYDTLMDILHNQGYRWYRTYEETDMSKAKNHWPLYTKNTCLNIETDGETVCFSSRDYYIRNNYKIINVKEYIAMNPEISKEQTAIFVSSQEQYNSLMKCLEKMGYVWRNTEKKPSAHNYFGEVQKLAVRLMDKKDILWGSVERLKEEGYKIITFSQFLKQYKVTTPKVNFLLKYDLETDPIEEFETMKEVEARIDFLVQNARNLKKDSFVIYEVAKKHTVEVSTKIVKKLVK